MLSTPAFQIGMLLKINLNPTPLTACDDAALEGQGRKQGLDGGNLVSLAPGSRLAQTQAAAGGKGADRVQCRVVPSTGAAQRLAIERHYAIDHADQSGHPAPKALLKDRGIKYPEHAAKGVMRRRPARKRQLPAQP